MTFNKNITIARGGNEPEKDIKRRRAGKKIYLFLLALYSFGFFIPNMQTPFFILGTCINLYILYILKKEICDADNVYLPLWLMTALFTLGYILKTYLLFLLSEKISFQILEYPANVYSSNVDLVAQAYLTSSIGFLLFFIVAKILIRRRIIENQKPEFRLNKLMIKFFLWLVIIGSIITGYFQNKYEIGIFGHDPVILPYKLSGLIYETRNRLIPYLLLVVIHILHLVSEKKLLMVSILIMVIHALSQSFLTTSRGAILIFLLPVLFLYVLKGRINLKTIFAFVVVPIFIVIATFTVLSEIRSLRSTNGGFDTKYFANTFQQSTQEAIAVGSEMSLKRIMGISGVICAIKNVKYPIPIGEFLIMLTDPENTFSDYYTHVVLGNLTENYHSSPSVIGLMFVVGLIPGVVIGMAIWAFFWITLWNYFLKENINTKLPILAMVAFDLFLYSHEGDPSSFFKTILWLVIFYFSGEYLFKRCVIMNKIS